MISKAQKSIKQFTAELILTDSKLNIELKSPTEDFTLATVLNNGELPLNFMNIFDNVAELFNFLRDAPGNSLDLVGNTLKIMVKTVVRLREVAIELTRTQISRLEILERRIEKFEKSQQMLGNGNVIHMQRETQRLLEEFAKKHIKPLTDEIKKLSEKVLALENKTRILDNRTRPASNLFNGVQPSEFPRNLFGIVPRPSEPKKTSERDSKETGAESMPAIVTIGAEKAENEEQLVPNRKAVCFVFDIDQNNKYLSDFFTISKNRIIRKIENEEIYMFSSSNPIPPTERHCLRIRIDKITDGLIWVGLITESKKQEQYIGEEKGIIQYSLEGNEVLVDGIKYPINVPEFKDGQMISMEVELPKRKLRFYRNNKPNPIVKITIPESMAISKLYPYVQLINAGDAIAFI